MDDQQHSYHYQVIRRAIEVIDRAGGAPVPLEHLAAGVNLSPAHFQRLFSRWVGVSPKRYQQYLSLDHAKNLLAGNFTTLAVAGELGLSGSGRLHDLFLRWEAMSPGEYARKGAGLNINYGWFDSPFGRLLAMGTEKGLCGLAFAEECGEAAARADLEGRWPEARFVENPAALVAWVRAGFGQTSGQRGQGGQLGEVPLHLIGAPFQIKVWEALLRIPSGQVTTYSEIANAVGKPRAARAVGSAVGRNPVSWLIPCHRALRKSDGPAGHLGGYHWGLPAKRAMLAYEAARRDAARP